MTEQERELFERRSLELAQARRVIDDLRARYTDVSKALSHVLHDNASLEAERDRLKSIADAVERDNLAKHGRIAELEHDYSAALNAQEAAEKEVFALRKEVDGLKLIAKRLADSYPAASPAIDESGEPAAYDVADTRSHAPEVTDDVARKVEWAMAGGVLEPIDRKWWPWRHSIDGDADCYDADRYSASWGCSGQDVATRAQHCGPCRLRPADWVPGRPEAPVEPKAEDTRPPGERVKVGDRVRVVWTEQRYERVGKVVCIDETRWPIEVMFDDSGKVGALRRDEILEILPESPVEPKAEDTRPPGERVKVGDRVRFKWFGGTDRGLVQTLIAGDWLGGWVSIVDCSADKAGVVVHADSILEILPEAP